MFRTELKSAAGFIFKWLDTAGNKLSELQMTLYGSPDPFKRRLFSAPLFHLNRLIYLFSRHLTVEAFVLSGIETSTGEPLRAACLMRQRSMDYFRSTIFSPETVKTEHRNHAFFWQARRLAKQLAPEVDLVILERNSILSWTPDAGEWVVTPHRVRMVLDFDPAQSWEDFEHGLKKQRQNIRRIQRAGFTPRISHDPADFDFFYQHIYLPTLEVRHKDFSVVETKAALMPTFNQGMLIFVDDAEGNVVSGALCYLEGDILIGIVLGVRDGSKELLDKGAMSALYYLIMKYCKENGIRRLDAGPVFPFARNGAYLHKRRWGFHPSADLRWNTEWLVWATRGSRTGLGWMASNPFIPDYTRCGGKDMGSLYTSLAAGAAEAVEA